jgi:hypothetical protein
MAVEPYQHAPNGFYNNSVQFPRFVNSIVLSAGTAASYVVPPGTRLCVITSDLPWYGCVSGAAVVPVASTTDGSSSFYVPAGMQCELEYPSTLSVIRATAASTIITIAHYS